jgi:oligo-1,6-glucosidase
MPVNPNYTEINAARAAADPDSVHAHYRRLIRLRHDLPVVAHGDFTMLVPDDPRVYAFLRSYEEDTLLVAANFSSEEAVVEIDDAGAWADAELVLGNLEEVARPCGPGLVLAPWEARVYLRRS